MSKKSKKEEKVEEVIAEIHIEEEDLNASDEAENWGDEFVVAANEMVDFVKKVIHEAGVRRIVIKNEKHNLNIQLPLVVGVAGALMMPAAITMATVVAALVTECSIIVERVSSAEEETAAAAA